MNWRNSAFGRLTRLCSESGALLCGTVNASTARTSLTCVPVGSPAFPCLLLHYPAFSWVLPGSPAFPWVPWRLTWTSSCSKPAGCRTGRRRAPGCCQQRSSAGCRGEAAPWRCLLGWSPAEERTTVRHDSGYGGGTHWYTYHMGMHLVAVAGLIPSCGPMLGRRLKTHFSPFCL